MSILGHDRKSQATPPKNLETTPPKNLKTNLPKNPKPLYYKKVQILNTIKRLKDIEL